MFILRLHNSSIVWKLKSICPNLIDYELESDTIYLDKVRESHNKSIDVNLKLKKNNISPFIMSPYIISFYINNDLETKYMFDITYSFFDSTNKLITTLNKIFYTQRKVNIDLECKSVTTTNTSFTILCKIIYGHHITSRINYENFFSIYPNEDYKNNESLTIMSNAMELIINDKGLKNPDLVIFSKHNGAIKVHSSILEAASPKLESMIKSRNNEKRLNLPNDHAAILEMIRFIYSGQIKNMKEVVVELLDLAYTLDLYCLQRICRSYVNDNTSIENAVNIFILANKWKAENLKVQTRTFVKKNFFDIVATKEYKNLKLSVPDLRNMIMS